MQITITDELKRTKCGVYIINFDNGMFYIGSSKILNQRVYNQTREILNNFSRPSCCIALRAMKGFDGECKISLLREVKIDKVRMFGALPEILRNEAEFILSNKDNEKCLNWNKTLYKRNIPINFK